MTWHPLETKIAFCTRVAELGNHAAACREFEIHRSTGHRWRIAVEEHNDQPIQPITRSRRNDPVLIYALKDTVWLSPDDGCATYAKKLKERGFDASPTTIQKILSELGLSTIAERLDAAEKRFVETGEALPNRTWRSLKKSGRMIQAANFKASYPGEVVAMTNYRWSREKTGFTHLLLVVDLYSLTIRARLWDGIDVTSCIVAFQDMTEFVRRRLFMKNPMRQVKDGKPFAQIGGLQFRTIWVSPDVINKSRPANAKFTAADDLMAYVLRLIKRGLVPLLRSSQQDIESTGCSAALDRWKWDFNVGHVYSGFPCFGLTPMQKIREFERSENFKPR